jgi:hypothetical protein
VTSIPNDDLAIESFAKDLADVLGRSNWRQLRIEAAGTLPEAEDVLGWRLDCAPPQRVFRLARAMIEHERERPTQAWESSSERQGDLSEVQR